jgi:hypothetical protein
MILMLRIVIHNRNDIFHLSYEAHMNQIHVYTEEELIESAEQKTKDLFYQLKEAVLGLEEI